MKNKIEYNNRSLQKILKNLNIMKYKIQKILNKLKI